MYLVPDTSKFTDAPVEFIDEVQGMAFRSTFLEKKGDLIGSHVHEHDHATFCGSGSARLWVDGVWREDIKRGQAVPVEAGHIHIFEALEDATLLACITEVSKLKGL